VPRRTIIIDAEENAAGKGTFTIQADLVMPSTKQLVILTPNGLQRRDASGYYYRADETLTSRTPVGGGHLAHLRVDPHEDVIVFSSTGRAWKGAVGFIPEEATPDALGLAKGEEIVGVAVATAGQMLVMVSQSGKIKRTKVEDLALIDRTWDVVMGLSSGARDRLLTGTVAGSDAHIVLYTQNGQALRIDSTTVNPQQTGSASGVAGIKLRKDDQLLGATVIPNGKDDKSWQVIVISENGYVHRFPLAGIALKGRATMGVRCLRIAKASGRLAALAVGLEKNNVDVYLADWRRQRIPIASLAPTSRDVQGDRLVRDSKKVPVVQAVVL